MTVAEVLERYQDLPAFCNAELTSVNQEGLFGDRPLGIAAVRGDGEELRALLEGGAEIDAAGDLGNTALHEALSQHNSSAAILLLESGARVDIKNEFGKTALDVMGARDREELLHMLRGYYK